MPRTRSALNWVFLRGPAHLYDVAESESLLPAAGLAGLAGLGGGVGALIGLAGRREGTGAAQIGAAIGLGLAATYLVLTIAFNCVLFLRGVNAVEAARRSERLDERTRKNREDFYWQDRRGPALLVVLLALVTLAAAALTATAWRQNRDGVVDEESFALGSVVALDGLMVMFWIATVAGCLLARRRVRELWGPERRGSEDR